jgi:hypothetical protein
VSGLYFATGNVTIDQASAGDIISCSLDLNSPPGGFQILHTVKATVPADGAEVPMTVQAHVTVSSSSQIQFFCQDLGVFRGEAIDPELDVIKVGALHS